MTAADQGAQPGAALLARLRRDVGLPMRGAYPARLVVVGEHDGDQIHRIQQTYIGFTNEQALADRARELGATVTHYPGSEPRFEGWEISVNVGPDAPVNG